MIASRSRLFAASLTVLAVALAGHASAQETTSPAPTLETHPPAVILEPGQTAPGQTAPAQAPTEAAPDPHIIITDTPATPAIPAGLLSQAAPATSTTRPIAAATARRPVCSWSRTASDAPWYTM